MFLCNIFLFMHHRFIPAQDVGNHGWEFLEEYKAPDSKLQATYMIVLTTSLNPEDEEKANSPDYVHDFRHKPLSFEMVQDVLNTFFQD